MVEPGIGLVPKPHEAERDQGYAEQSRNQDRRVLAEVRVHLAGSAADDDQQRISGDLAVTEEPLDSVDYTFVCVRSPFLVLQRVENPRVRQRSPNARILLAAAGTQHTISAHQRYKALRAKIEPLIEARKISWIDRGCNDADKFTALIDDSACEIDRRLVADAADDRLADQQYIPVGVALHVKMFPVAKRIPARGSVKVLKNLTGLAGNRKLDTDCHYKMYFVLPLRYVESIRAHDIVLSNLTMQHR